MSILIFGTQPEKINPEADYAAFFLTPRTQQQFAIMSGAGALKMINRSVAPTRIGFRKIT